MCVLELCEGLLALRHQGSHWTCEDRFLRLCSLHREELAAIPKTFWGNQDLWLDMLCTEIVRGIFSKSGLEHHPQLSASLGVGWKTSVDSWLEEAYNSATLGMSFPPARPIMSAKAIPFVVRSLSRLGQENMPHAVNVQQRYRPAMRATLFQKNRSFMQAAKPSSVVCQKCGLDFSQRLGQCPTCCPSKPSQSTLPAHAEQAVDSWQDCLSARISDDLAWLEASDVKWCHGGSGGATLIRLPSGVVCVKRCTPLELFAQRMAQALKVPTAGMRPIRGREEHSLINQAIGKHVEQHEKGFIRRKGGDLVAVMEFVDGCVMMGIPAHNYLRKDLDATPPWHELGRLMAFDMLINNFDRLPLVWLNDGNLTNVMLGSISGVVVGIDQAVHPITHTGGRQDYMVRVQGAAIEARDGVAKCFTAAKEAIYNNTAADLTVAEMSSLRSGCFDFLTEIVALVEAGCFEPIVQAVSKDVAAHLAQEDDEDSDRSEESSMRHSRDMICQVAQALREVLR